MILDMCDIEITPILDIKVDKSLVGVYLVFIAEVSPTGQNNHINLYVGYGNIHQGILDALDNPCILKACEFNPQVLSATYVSRVSGLDGIFAQAIKTFHPLCGHDKIER